MTSETHETITATKGDLHFHFNIPKAASIGDTYDVVHEFCRYVTKLATDKSKECLDESEKARETVAIG